MKKNRAFTLIELIAVLVIMAILALIVTPLVMSIIRKTRISARKRSIDAYGRSVELAIAGYLLDNGAFPTSIGELTVEYSGEGVSCNIMQIKENGGVYLSECKVNNVDVKDSSTEDGWYHYGTRDLTNEDYVDMYGKSLEKALKLYYDEHSSYPSDYTTLSLDYKGKQVSAEVVINIDGTVYLTNCSVAGVQVLDANNDDGYYHYGIKKYNSYNIGDIVTYNGVEYRVIENSGILEQNVKLLKSTPLTTSEVNNYGVGHVNKYTYYSTGTAYDSEGYGAVAYYSSDTCGYINNTRIITGCTTEYGSSDIKYIVDAWAQSNVGANGVQEVRIITIDDLENLGYEEDNTSYNRPYKNDNAPDWLYNNSYGFWTMSSVDNDYFRMYFVDGLGCLTDRYQSEYGGTNYAGYIDSYVHSAKSNPTVYYTVRPVIIISKDVI